MDLTLPQRLYLLSYDIDQNRFDPVSIAYRGQLLCAAALAQLTAAGQLRVHNATAERTTARPPEDPFLADVLADVSPDKPRHFNSAVYLRAAEAEKAVREQLTANGTITVDRGRALGIFPTRTVTLGHPEQVRVLREHTRNAVLAGHDAAAVPFGDAALAAIAAEGDIWTAFTPGERSAHRPMLTAIQERFDTAVPGLRIAIRAAVMATGRGASY
ncbi:Golgi phosphoprotein 3 GPP34 [Murinocardiopsis flavida]|uniref:Golgi phosphoprotein 3 GPP34 n=1 Tax=Murinocardiopsis flavida TaxID=645275 RepID=A0A2P8DGE9_9ACTN|nr:GPP34 family phosphoprotein [Murinocardiopsis flavida]PSK96283.1 Golgi phosphoprotein 3 GPP34 [Murinocardiopsis flavida]